MHLIDPPCRLAIAAVIALVTLVGCSGAEPAAAPPTTTGSADPTAAPSSVATVAPPAGLSASLVQYRRDQPRRFVEVKLDNSTDATLDVTLLAVALPGFTPSTDVLRTTNMKADRRVDLPVALGEVICDRPPDGTARATVEVASDDGSTRRTVLPVDDDGLLDRLRGFECALQRANAAVAIELAPTWQRQGSGSALTVRGEATITAQSSDVTADITAVDGGILFVVKPDAVIPPPPITVDDGQPQATIAFDMIPARCDGHAIAEAKRLTTVTFLVAVDGDEPVPLRRAPAEAGYQTLVTALRERCDTG